MNYKNDSVVNLRYPAGLIYIMDIIIQINKRHVYHLSSVYVRDN